MNALQRFLVAGEEYLALAQREELAGRRLDNFSDKMLEKETAKLLALRRKRFRERNKMLADADEVARLCQQAGEDAKLVYVATEAAYRGGGPPEFRKQWKALQAMLRLVALGGNAKPVERDTADPFEAMHDRTKEQRATDMDIGKAYYTSRKPTEKNKLIAKHGGAMAAIKSIARRCEYIRWRRKQQNS